MTKMYDLDLTLCLHLHRQTGFIQKRGLCLFTQDICRSEWGLSQIWIQNLCWYLSSQEAVALGLCCLDHVSYMLCSDWTVFFFDVSASLGDMIPHVILIKSIGKKHRKKTGWRWSWYTWSELDLVEVCTVPASFPLLWSSQPLLLLIISLCVSVEEH